MSKKHSGIEIPTRPPRTEPKADPAAMDDWVKNGRRPDAQPQPATQPATRGGAARRTAAPEPPAGPIVRMTFRIAEDLRERFLLAATVAGEKPYDVLNRMVVEYIETHAADDNLERSLDNIKRSLKG